MATLPPVAAAFPVNGTVYIALVATLPEEQGKGYAETVMRQAVAQGQEAMGTKRTTLHASDMGLPVYRRMGYRRPGFRMVYPATHRNKSGYRALGKLRCFLSPNKDQLQV